MKKTEKNKKKQDEKEQNTSQAQCCLPTGPCPGRRRIPRSALLTRGNRRAPPGAPPAPFGPRGAPNSQENPIFRKLFFFLLFFLILFLPPTRPSRISSRPAAGDKMAALPVMSGGPRRSLRSASAPAPAGLPHGPAGPPAAEAAAAAGGGGGGGGGREGKAGGAAQNMAPRPTCAAVASRSPPAMAVVPRGLPWSRPSPPHSLLSPSSSSSSSCSPRSF